MFCMIDPKQNSPVVPENKVAIVSIVIGSPFQETWERLCRKSWEYYAAVYGFDVIIITDHLDQSDRSINRSPSWQKLLTLSQPWSAQYDRIIWLDADVIVSPNAPNILDYVPHKKKVGISISGDRMSTSEKHIYLERIKKINIKADHVDSFWMWDNVLHIETYGIKSKTGVMYNGGVMVASPRHHKKLFLEVYENEDKGRLYEQPYLSSALDSRGLAEVISPRFNWGILETSILYMPDKTFIPYDEFEEKDKEIIWYLIRREFNNAYFLHFYGCMGMMMNLPGLLV